jgi:uncharacterized protein
VIFFLDASSLVKLYHQERGSETMREIFRRSEYVGAFFTSDLVALEVVVTLYKLQRIAPRKLRRAFGSALNRFEYDRSQYLNILEVQPSIIRMAEFLLMSRRESGAGTLDFVHVASAFHVRSTLPDEELVFIVSDRKLKSLVERIGLQAFDPERQGMDDLGHPRIL